MKLARNAELVRAIEGGTLELRAMRNAVAGENIGAAPAVALAATEEEDEEDAAAATAACVGLGEIAGSDAPPTTDLDRPRGDLAITGSAAPSLFVAAIDEAATVADTVSEAPTMIGGVLAAALVALLGLMSVLLALEDAALDRADGAAEFDVDETAEAVIDIALGAFTLAATAAAGGCAAEADAEAVPAARAAAVNAATFSSLLRLEGPTCTLRMTG